MRKNVVWWDRLIRFVLGVFLLAWTVAGGPAWGYVGLYFLMTGSWGFCPMYAFMNRQPFEEE